MAISEIAIAEILKTQICKQIYIFSERAKKHKIYFYEEGSFYFLQDIVLALNPFRTRYVHGYVLANLSTAPDI